MEPYSIKVISHSLLFKLSLDFDELRFKKISRFSEFFLTFDLGTDISGGNSGGGHL